MIMHARWIVHYGLQGWADRISVSLFDCRVVVLKCFGGVPDSRSDRTSIRRAT